MSASEVMFVKQSAVKEYIKSQDCRTSGEAIEALNAEIAGLLDRAIVRCKDNKRGTVKPQDL